MVEHILTFLGIGGILVLFYLFIKPDKAPSATGVSSSSERRGKERVRITFLHCWLFSAYPLMPFRSCPEHDGYLLLTQAMQPIRTLLPVAHYKEILEKKGLHPIIKREHCTGDTDWTLTITWGAMLYTSHRLKITHDQARYWLLCHFYAAITQQELTQVIIEEEEEEQEEDIEESQPVRIAEPVPSIVVEEEPVKPTWEMAFYRANTDKLLPLDVEELEEEPLPTLTELVGKDQGQFLSVFKDKLTRIYTIYQQAGKITQPLLLKEILKQSEWKFLLNGEVGILWELAIVERNDLGETIMSKDLDDAFSLVEAWSNEQIWER